MEIVVHMFFNDKLDCPSHAVYPVPFSSQIWNLALDYEPTALSTATLFFP